MQLQFIVEAQITQDTVQIAVLPHAINLCKLQSNTALTFGRRNMVA